MVFAPDLDGGQVVEAARGGQHHRPAQAQQQVLTIVFARGALIRSAAVLLTKAASLADQAVLKNGMYAAQTTCIRRSFQRQHARYLCRAIVGGATSLAG